MKRTVAENVIVPLIKATALVPVTHMGIVCGDISRWNSLGMSISYQWMTKM